MKRKLFKLERKHFRQSNDTMIWKYYRGGNWISNRHWALKRGTWKWKDFPPTPEFKEITKSMYEDLERFTFDCKLDYTGKEEVLNGNKCLMFVPRPLLESDNPKQVWIQKRYVRYFKLDKTPMFTVRDKLGNVPILNRSKSIIVMPVRK